MTDRTDAERIAQGIRRTGLTYDQLESTLP